jgi:GrpB-like predicted nucleotidyltransferase (UPF0157 family)
MDDALKGRLVEIGVDLAYVDPFDVWLRLRTQYGPRVNVIDLYALVAHPRGLEAHELPISERRQLCERAFVATIEGFETLPGSERPEPEPIEIVVYDEKWPQLFAAWRERLANALGATAIRIEHVGSTAVPGLPAKPIIDIQISVDDLEEESRYVPPIEALGVQLRSRGIDWRFFRPFTGLPRDVHVHVCAVGSEWEKRHLLFRDYLRADAHAREAYTRAKLLAAALWRDDRIAYTEAKDDQIRELMAAAERNPPSWSRPWSV